ncbi:DNA-binding MarR family transcriptional regulator [Methylobacterium sp. PvP105]|nr:DNA-binding MarR family transcriptional regulator [Methylobacterium sp. PvP105]
MKRNTLLKPKTGSRNVDAYLFREQVGFLLRVAYQRHSAIFAARMTANVTQTQLAALVALYKHGPCAHNELGQLICLDAATIKGVVDRLRDGGLLDIRVNESDRRSRTVSLSPLGRQTVEIAIEDGFRITEETLEPLSQDERGVFLDMLRRLG